MNMSKPTTASPWVDWSPWTVKGDRRIVASERAWQRVLEIAAPDKRSKLRDDPARARAAICLIRPRIRVVPDLFEDWTGPMVDAKGEDLFQCCQCQHSWAANMDDYDPSKRDVRIICRKCKSDGPNEMTLADVRRRVFDLIDATPNVDWLVSTAATERVAGMMPPQGIGDFRDSDTVCTISLEPRPNLWLGARISTQAEADERIPCLLRLPAARRWLNVSPTEGIDLRFGRSHGQPSDAEPFRELADLIAWVRIAGGTNHAHPLVDQCRAAGVPCWHEGDENVRETP